MAEGLLRYFYGEKYEEDFDLLRFSLNAPPGRLKNRSRAS
jgi:hypothetical protein